VGSHHHIFERAESYNSLMMLTNLGWLFTIVVLPFPTDMVAEFRSDRFTVGFYIGTMLISLILQLVLIRTFRKNPELMRDGSSLDESLRGVAASVMALAAALIIGVLVPGGTYFGLLLLPVPDIIDRVRRRTPATP
jgi:uncharacterized membrane protein